MGMGILGGSFEFGGRLRFSGRKQAGGPKARKSLAKPRLHDPQHGALFAFLPGMADCLGYSDLARALDPYAFYGFTFLEGDDRIVQYADLIQSTPAAEPYLLFGYSSGGNMAYHVARELESRGKRVVPELAIHAFKVSCLASRCLFQHHANQVSQSFPKKVLSLALPVMTLISAFHVM
jgi:hypothetical protein